MKLNETQIIQSLKSLRHLKNYSQKILLNDNSNFLGLIKYKEYPFASFENDDYFIYLEGKIYGKKKSTIETELYDLAKNISQNSKNANDRIIQWLLTTDGDFIIFIKHKKNAEIYILNDIMGHLPVYTYNVDKKLYVCRDVRFILNLLTNIKFDKMSIAQFLLFRNPLGKRTIFKDIHRLEPGSLIKIYPKQSKFEINNIHRFNFENRKYTRVRNEDNINRLCTLLINACSNRIKARKGFKNIMALSGGIDSRMVFSSLVNSNNPFSCVSFMDFKRTNKLDVEMAEQLAKIYNLDWKLFYLEPPKGKDFLKILRIKNSLNYLSMSFILSFYNKLRKTYGSKIILFTGDTGLALRGLIPNERLRNIDDLVNLVLQQNAQIKLNEVAELVGIREDEIKNEIKEYLQSFPENDLGQKFVHFIIFEKGFNWHNEGMDRTRSFFWTANPLESTLVFDYAMNCPDNKKANYNYFRECLLKISPEIVKLNYVNYGLPLTSKKLRFKFFLGTIIDKLPASAREYIKKKFYKHYSIKFHSYNHNSVIMRCLRKQLSNCPAISEILSSSYINDFVKNCNKNQFNILLTLTSTIEDFVCKDSSFQKYLEDELI